VRGHASAHRTEDGCANNYGHGAILRAVGSTHVAAGDLQLLVSQARPNRPGVLIQGASQVVTPIRDDIFCTGNPTERIETIITDANGEGMSVSSIATEEVVSVGETRFYQYGYRDPQLSLCASGSNFSSRHVIDWD